MMRRVLARALEECAAQYMPRPELEDLATQARGCGYRVKGMAGQLGCSCRWLELFCHKRFALTPHTWLARLRDAEIKRLAGTGMPAKAICQLVGFADAASLCHGLRRAAGCTLRELREVNQRGRSQKDNKGGSPPITGRRQTRMVRRSGPRDQMGSRVRG